MMYQIEIAELIDQRLVAWLGVFEVTYTTEGSTLLCGDLIDQAAFYGVFTRCRDLGITIISVNRLVEAKEQGS
jgi:hypothetical protein